jgi:hypothetical protein
MDEQYFKDGNWLIRLFASGEYTYYPDFPTPFVKTGVALQVYHDLWEEFSRVKHKESEKARETVVRVLESHGIPLERVDIWQ